LKVPLSTAQQRALARKAGNNTLEVEHLLRVLSTADATDAPFIRSLSTEYGWSVTGVVGRRRVVPFACWADAVCRYLEGGCAAVVRMSQESPSMIEFCLGVLEEVKTAESVSAMLEVGSAEVELPVSDVPRAVRIADGLNLLLSFKGAPAVSPTVELQVRDFLHRLLDTELTEAQRASVVCALRGVGDQESVDRIAALPPFKGSWAGVEQTSTKQILQRLRQRSRPD
jgi:hypothetical protein